MSAKTDTWADWVDRNPLRVWRRRTHTPIMQAASMLDVSMTIIQLWERGVHVPGDENFGKIVALVGDSVVREWSDWYNEKPHV